MEERVVAMNATEAKTKKMTILDEQVAVAKKNYGPQGGVGGGKLQRY